MKKVLIVDDEPSIRKLVVASLRKEHVQVLQAVNTDEALRLSHDEHPDLIVMDIVMLGQQIDGLAACLSLKKDPDTAQCKILLISGAVTVNEQQLVESGADGFLTKPFNPIKLRLRISHMLGL